MNRNFKFKDRVVSNRKMGSIPAQSAGRFIEDFRSEEMPNQDENRVWVDLVVVRFDEHPHDYIVNRLGLDREPDPSTKPRCAKGRFT
jgi:hypothetical protein